MQSTTRLAVALSPRVTAQLEGDPLPSLGNDFLLVEEATKADHKELVRIAKTSKYTKDFSNSLMFSSDVAYAKGWIMKAILNGKIVGLSCVRHKRDGTTMLYFVTIDPECRSKGIGEKLLTWVMMRGPHQRMRLNVMKDNTKAIAFYDRLGFAVVGEAMKATAWQMEKTF